MILTEFHWYEWRNFSITYFRLREISIINGIVYHGVADLLASRNDISPEDIILSIAYYKAFHGAVLSFTECDTERSWGITEGEFLEKLKTAAT